MDKYDTQHDLDCNPTHIIRNIPNNNHTTYANILSVYMKLEG